MINTSSFLLLLIYTELCNTCQLHTFGGFGKSKVGRDEIADSFNVKQRFGTNKGVNGNIFENQTFNSIAEDKEGVEEGLGTTEDAFGSIFEDDEQNRALDSMDKDEDDMKEGLGTTEEVFEDGEVDNKDADDEFFFYEDEEDMKEDLGTTQKVFENGEVDNEDADDEFFFYEDEDENEDEDKDLEENVHKDSKAEDGSPKEKEPVAPSWEEVRKNVLLAYQSNNMNMVRPYLGRGYIGNPLVAELFFNSTDNCTTDGLRTFAQFFFEVWKGLPHKEVSDCSVMRDVEGMLFEVIHHDCRKVHDVATLMAARLQLYQYYEASLPYQCKFSRLQLIMNNMRLRAKRVVLNDLNNFFTHNDSMEEARRGIIAMHHYNADLLERILRKVFTSHKGLSVVDPRSLSLLIMSPELTIHLKIFLFKIILGHIKLTPWKSAAGKVYTEAPEEAQMRSAHIFHFINNSIAIEKYMKSSSGLNWDLREKLDTFLSDIPLGMKSLFESSHLLQYRRTSVFMELGDKYDKCRFNVHMTHDRVVGPSYTYYGSWAMEWLGLNRFRIRYDTPEFNETFILIASVLRQDQDRRRVYTWVKGKSPPSEVWLLEPTGNTTLRIKSETRQEYLYADVHGAFTWIPGGFRYGISSGDLEEPLWEIF